MVKVQRFLTEQRQALVIGLTVLLILAEAFRFIGSNNLMYQILMAIAGVIAMEPSVLILDEPTAGLDPLGVKQVLSNIQAYHKAKNATIIMVSHSMEEMARTADRLVVIHEGKIPFQGPPKEVFAHGVELENMGLGVPQMTRVFSRLRALGADIDPAVYTVAQAKAALLAALGKGAE